MTHTSAPRDDLERFADRHLSSDPLPAEELEANLPVADAKAAFVQIEPDGTVGDVLVVYAATAVQLFYEEGATPPWSFSGELVPPDVQWLIHEHDESDDYQRIA